MARRTPDLCRALAAIALALAGCTSLPFLPRTVDADGRTMFRFDVENRSSQGVVVSVASDTAATLPGFEPGQQGSIVIALLNPENGISVEIQGPPCSLLASAMYPTPAPFTLVISDGARPEVVELSVRPGVTLVPVPLPRNDLVGCSG